MQNILFNHVERVEGKSNGCCGGFGRVERVDRVEGKSNGCCGGFDHVDRVELLHGYP